MKKIRSLSSTAIRDAVASRIAAQNDLAAEISSLDAAKTPQARRDATMRIFALREAIRDAGSIVANAIASVARASAEEVDDESANALFASLAKVACEHATEVADSFNTIRTERAKSAKETKRQAIASEAERLHNEMLSRLPAAERARLEKLFAEAK